MTASRVSTRATGPRTADQCASGPRANRASIKAADAAGTSTPSISKPAIPHTTNASSAEPARPTRDPGECPPRRLPDALQRAQAARPVQPLGAVAIRRSVVELVPAHRVYAADLCGKRVRLAQVSRLLL